MRTKFLTVIFLLPVLLMHAQYRTAIGLIGGIGGYGLSVKHFIKPEKDLQFNLLYRNKGGQLIALYEFHKEIHASTLHNTNLTWSYGGGLHGGYWQNSSEFSGGNTALGVDLALGFEYGFGFIPITFGVQARPYYDILYTVTKRDPNARRNYFDASVNVRFIIAD